MKEMLPTFAVVVNSEEQYSLWPVALEVPDGWCPAGFEGAEQDCLDWISEAWVDMRPASVRAALSGRAETKKKHLP
ncbi:MbtH family protein [Streptomyces sp. NPDC087908]|uniref:MbtH family protein n=1 Tax=Streptomyces sp. NPDC087908 TaxID=3365820 RepID=UPI0038196E2D